MPASKRTGETIHALEEFAVAWERQFPESKKKGPRLKMRRTRTSVRAILNPDPPPRPAVSEAVAIHFTEPP